MKPIEEIKTIFSNTPDLIIRKIKKNLKTIYLVYLESVASGDRVNNYVLRNLISTENKHKKITDIISAPNTKEINKEEMEFYLSNGFTLVITHKEIWALETKAELDRSISPAEVEPALYGSKDALVENFQKNLGLIKRRIKNAHLKIQEFTLGRYTKTTTGLLYIDNIVKPQLVEDVIKKINTINTEAIISSGELKQFLINENRNVFPSAQLSERPDTIVKALLAGKVVIIVDTSPFAIILPAVLADFINPTVDSSTNSLNTNFLKVLRFVCLIITILAPAFYIAITNFNHESVPTLLLMNIATQRFGVPFPSILEAFTMLFICELIRESDIRFPNSYGSAISILSALILGESAVASGIVSPIMIIIIALTFVSSLIFNEVEMNGAIRAWRYLFLISAAFLGLYGITVCFLFMLINLCSFETFNLNYMFPIAPLDFSYLKETLIKTRRKYNDKRSKYLTDNIRKQK